MHSPSLAIATSLIIIFSLLAYPVLTTLSPHPRGPEWAVTQVKTSVKLAFLVSLLPLFLYLNEGAETVITNLTWIKTITYDINISLKFDFYSTFFIPVALYVT